jgi:hypothetical protein
MRYRIIAGDCVGRDLRDTVCSLVIAGLFKERDSASTGAAISMLVGARSFLAD